jgi:hypothetical protein
MLARAGRTDVAFLREQLLVASPDELVVIRQELLPHAPTVEPPLWEILIGSESSAGQRVRAASALAHMADASDDRWMLGASDLARALVRLDTVLLDRWIQELAPVRDLLREPLTEIFRGGGAEGGDQIVAAIALAALLRDDAKALGDLLLGANESQYPMLFDAFARHRSEAKPWLLAELAKLNASQVASVSEEAIRRESMLAVTLARLEEPSALWSSMRPSPDPRLKATLIHQLACHGVDPQRLLAHLDQEQDASVRHALVLALGEYVISNMPIKTRNLAIDRCRDLFRADPSGAVHSAAEWTLRRWGETDFINAATDELRGQTVGDWSINGQGQTMLTVRPTRQSTDDPPLRPFFISAHEVTVAQYQVFFPDARHAEGAGQSLSCPINFVSWYAAAR